MYKLISKLTVAGLTTSVQWEAFICVSTLERAEVLGQKKLLTHHRQPLQVRVVVKWHSPDKSSSSQWCTVDNHWWVCVLELSCRLH